MWNEEHLIQVIWKEVAKVVEGVEEFFGTNENLQLIMAKLDEFTPKQDIQVVVGLLVIK